MRTIHVETSCQMSNRLLNDSIWKLETAIGRVRETLLHFHTKRIKHEAWRFYWYCFHLTNTIVLIIFQVNNKIVSLQRCILHLVKLRFSAEWFHKKFRNRYLTDVCASGLTNWICSKLWKMTTDYCQLRSF